MKRTIMILSLAIAVATLYAKDIKTVVFTTEPPLECAGCEAKIKGNLRFEKGIKEISTDIENQEVRITYDADKTSPEAFVKALAKIGFRAVENTPEADKTSCKH